MLQDAWAICKIFKKASPAVQRSLSHSWISPSSVTLADLPDKHSVNQHTNPNNTSTTNTTSSVVPRTLSASKCNSNLNFSGPCRTLFPPALMTSSQNLNSSLLSSFNMSSSSSSSPAGDSVKSPSYLSLVDHVYGSSVENVTNNAGEISGVVKSNGGVQWEPTMPNLGFSFLGSTLPNMHSWELASSENYPTNYI